ncbi:MAG: hypothetical protein PUG67_05110 [Peptoniphilaceae bacterium]|nr:hypothetical protein [Peptoniphilaceae bacterium]MDY6018933.1 hypothetical protein [Anaerococcus sp.]
MIDISSKLSSFRRLVWDVEKKKSEKQLYDSINISTDIIENKKSELEKYMKTYLEKRKVFATTRKNEIVARKTEEEKSTYNLYKEELLKTTIDEIKKELLAYSKTSEYKTKLKEEVEETFNKLKKNSDQAYILLVKEEDLNLFEKYDTEIMSDANLGGFIIEDTNKTYQYDYTLKRKLDNEKYEIGKKLYSLMEGGDLNNDTNN